MARLFVTDLDGTLLNAKKEMPQDFLEVLQALEEKGDTLAIATGRSYPGVTSVFGDSLSRLACICDNGAYTAWKGEEVGYTPMDGRAVTTLMTALRTQPILIPSYTIRDHCYLEHIPTLDPHDIHEFFRYASTYKDCDDMMALPDVPNKITIYYRGDIEKDWYPWLRQFQSDKLALIVSGKVWVDAFDPSVSKGWGVQELQQQLGISPSDTYVFGDFTNDLSLAPVAQYSYAMANAHPAVKEAFKEVIGDCESGAVTTKIREIIGF